MLFRSALAPPPAYGLGGAERGWSGGVAPWGTDWLVAFINIASDVFALGHAPDGTIRP